MAPIYFDLTSSDSDSDTIGTERAQASGAGRSRRVATISGLMALGLVLAVVVVRAGKASSRSTLRGPSGLQMKAEATMWVQGKDFPSQALPMDVDVEYSTSGGWGINYDHIPDPEMCAAMCQGVARCKAYTWVKDAGLDGCPSQCWLKDAVGERVPKKGVVSGVPGPALQ